MPSSLLFPPDIETTNDIYPDETPPSLWLRLFQLGNREVATSLSGVLTFFCIMLVSLTVVGILAVYVTLNETPQDPLDPTISTQCADNCVKALTETLAKERSANLRP